MNYRKNGNLSLGLVSTTTPLVALLNNKIKTIFSIILTKCKNTPTTFLKEIMM